MPTEEEFDEALDLLSQYVKDIGDEVDSNLDSRPGIGIGGPEVRGFWCLHGSASYAIVSDPSRKYFEIIYPRMIIGNIAEQLEQEAIEDLLSDYTEEEIEEILGEKDGAEQIEPEDIPESLLQELDLDMTIEEVHEADELPEELDEIYLGGREYLASEEWLRSLEPDLMQDIKYHLKNKLTNTEVGYSLRPENGDVVYGFQVNKKIFPYESGFSLQMFNDSVQAVISIGVDGENFLATTFGLSEELGTPSLPDA